MPFFCLKREGAGGKFPESTIVDCVAAALETSRGFRSRQLFCISCSHFAEAAGAHRWRQFGQGNSFYWQSFAVKCFWSFIPCSV